MSDIPGVSQPHPLRKRGRDEDDDEDQVQQALLVETNSNSPKSSTSSEQRSFKRAKVANDPSASTATLPNDAEENMGMDFQPSLPSGSESQTSTTPNIIHAPITLENTPSHASSNSPYTLSALQTPIDLEYPLPPRPAQDHDMTDAEVQAISLHGQRMGLIRTASGEEADEYSPQYLRASRRARKRQRALDHMPNPLKGCPVTTLPFELIAEITSLLDTRDMLSLARTSKWFCATLVNPDATFIWRAARANCSPTLLDDPLPNFTESAWAAFVYDGGNCDFCGKYTQKSLSSFAIRRRVCHEKVCRESPALYQFIDLRTSPNNEMSKLIASGLVFDERRSRISTLPEGMEGMMAHFVPVQRFIFRKDDWTAAVNEYNMAVATGMVAELVESYKKKRAVRKGVVMDSLVAVSRWRKAYDRKVLDVSHKNDTLWRNKSDEYKLPKQDMVNSETLISLRHRYARMALEITPEVWEENAAEILEETQILNLRRMGREEARLRNKHRHETDNFWKLTKDTSFKDLPFPPLSEFRSLPMVKVLIKKHFGDDDMKKDLTDENSLLSKLIRDNVRDWTSTMKKKFTATLEFKRAPGTKKIQPIDRVTALFKCRICAPLATGRAINNATLNFKAACAHTCLGRFVHEHDNWEASRFARDENAIVATRKVLQVCGLDETTATMDDLKKIGKRLRCETCYNPTILDAEDFLGHARRHAVFSVSLLSESHIDIIPTKRPVPSGTVKKLFGRSRTAEAQRSIKKYGCSHCPFSKRRLNFNGLICHLDATHSIKDMRDEDIYEHPDTPGNKHPVVVPT